MPAPNKPLPKYVESAAPILALINFLACGNNWRISSSKTWCSSGFPPSATTI